MGIQRITYREFVADTLSNLCYIFSSLNISCNIYIHPFNLCLFGLLKGRFVFLLYVYGELSSILVTAEEKLVSREGLNKVSSLIDKDVIFLIRKLQQTCLHSVLIFLQFMH